MRVCVCPGLVSVGEHLSLSVMGVGQSLHVVQATCTAVMSKAVSPEHQCLWYT